VLAGRVHHHVTVTNQRRSDGCYEGGVRDDRKRTQRACAQPRQSLAGYSAHSERQDHDGSQCQQDLGRRECRSFRKKKFCPKRNHGEVDDFEGYDKADRDNGVSASELRSLDRQWATGRDTHEEETGRVPARHRNGFR